MMKRRLRGRRSGQSGQAERLESKWLNTTVSKKGHYNFFHNFIKFSLKQLPRSWENRARGESQLSQSGRR